MADRHRQAAAGASIYFNTKPKPAVAHGCVYVRLSHVHTGQSRRCPVVPWPGCASVRDAAHGVGSLDPCVSVPQHTLLALPMGEEGGDYWDRQVLPVDCRKALSYAAYGIMELFIFQ